MFGHSMDFPRIITLSAYLRVGLVVKRNILVILRSEEYEDAISISYNIRLRVTLPRKSFDAAPHDGVGDRLVDGRHKRN